MVTIPPLLKLWESDLGGLIAQFTVERGAGAPQIGSIAVQ